MYLILNTWKYKKTAWKKLTFFDIIITKIFLTFHERIYTYMNELEYKETRYSINFMKNSDLAFYGAGRQQCSPDYAYGPRVRPYNVIHFIKSGCGSLYIGNEEYSLHAGECFIIPTGTVAYYQADHKNPWKYAWICFLGLKSQTYINEIMSSLTNQYILNSSQIDLYWEDIGSILTLPHNTISSYLHANGILLKLLARMFEDIDYKEVTDKKQTTANNIRFYLDMNYSKPLRLNEVAHTLGLHPNYMTRLFHEHFHISPKQYLMNLKMQKAQNLLEDTMLPIQTIANSLGFEDALAFSKSFKGKYGISPSLYRNEKMLNNTGEKKTL